VGSFLLVACAQGEDDPFPDFDASSAGDSAVKHDGAAPSDGSVPDTSPGDDDANPGDDSSPGDDSGPVDSGPGVDANEAGHVGNDGGPATKPTQGEVLITEVMYNPSTLEPDTEWFEVYNAASGPRDIGGLVMGDGTRTETITGSVVVPAGAYVVLANKNIGSTVPASSIAYLYSNLQLANSNTAASVLLSDSATTIAQAPYGGFSATIKAQGSSLQLQSLTYADESVSASWCKSTLTWSGSTDKGTPGAATKCQ
jgi:hypothetical protein